MRAAARILLLAAVAVALLPAAAAHVQVAATNPSAGSHLDAVPARVSFTLTLEVLAEDTQMKALAADGSRVDEGPFSITNSDGRSTVSIALRPGLPDGVYTFEITTRGGDPHYQTYRSSFAVGGFTAPSDVSGGSGIELEAAVARFLVYLGLTLAFGGVAFVSGVLPGRATMRPGLEAQAVAAGAAAHLAGTLLLLHYTATASHLSYADFWHTDTGQNLFLRSAVAVAALVVALGSALGKTRAGSTLAGILLAGNLLLTAMGSHSAVYGPVPVFLDALHLAAAALWLGGLLLYLLLVARGIERDDLARLRAVGARFGTLAFACVVVLAGTGLVTGLSIIGRERALDAAVWSSPYGLFLAGKVALWAVMVALAAVNRYILLAVPGEAGLARPAQALGRALTGGRLRPLADSSRPFQRALAVEAVLGVAVLVLAGFLTSISPPAEAHPADELTLTADGTELAAHLRVAPMPRAGATSDLRFIVMGADGHHVRNNTCGAEACVHLSLAPPGNATPERRVALPDGDAWVVAGVPWAQAGHWTLTLQVSTETVFLDEIEFSVHVA